MNAAAFDSSALLSYFRGQLSACQPLFAGKGGDLTLLAPPERGDLDAACQALDALRRSGEIREFHPVSTPAAYAFLVELQPA